ncbi:MAG: porin [Alphaproteobacteria bacterium]|jgi:predicted porin|nr:porin [Alphaproteobacteria bacterium]
MKRLLYGTPLMMVAYALTAQPSVAAERREAVIGAESETAHTVVPGGFGRLVFGAQDRTGYQPQFRPESRQVAGEQARWTDSGEGCGDDKRLSYFTPRFSGFQFGASYAAACGGRVADTTRSADGRDGLVSLGADFERKIDRFELGLSAGYSHGDRPSGAAGGDPEALAFGARFGFGNFRFGGFYGSRLDDAQGLSGDPSVDVAGFGIGLSYATGAWDLSVMYLRGEGEDRIDEESARDALRLGAEYNLGPGIDLSGSVGWVDRETATGAGPERDDGGWYVVGGVKVSF